MMSKNDKEFKIKYSDFILNTSRIGSTATVQSGYEPLDLRISKKDPSEEIKELQKKLKKRTLKDIVKDDIIEEIYLKRVRKLA